MKVCLSVLIAKKYQKTQTILEPEVPLDDSHGDELLVQFISVVEDAVRTRSLRNRISIRRAARYEVNLVEFHEPKTYEEVISGANAEKWKEELKAHETNGT
ncbi:transcriptional regulator [Lasius niger]|uniref:Transcriptional regulator n=1 Tax=Lasius niger TaxID=67767 RepID=A0A0J7KNZ8_LASNI|nr:transcriptional regulator [Lasius niger]